MYTIDLNCDMGEGLSNDAQLMPWISSANIACGYHAGNKSIMQQTVALATQYSVAIGAHPGFDDPENFGRTEQKLPLNEIFDLVAEQVYSLQKITQESGTKLHHVKPHGALYNMSAKDALLANTIAKAVYQADKDLVLYGLSGSCSISEAKKIGLTTASEVFADRTYQADGSLTPRTKAGAMLESTEDCLRQVLQMIEYKTVNALSGECVSIVADSLCIHGDGAHAVSFSENIYRTLQKYSVDIKTI